MIRILARWAYYEAAQCARELYCWIRGHKRGCQWWCIRCGRPIEPKKK